MIVKKDLSKVIPYEPDFENEDGFWNFQQESTVLNSEALQEHLHLCKKTGADAVLVVHKKNIVCEWYSNRYSPPLCAMSSTKSITSLLIGIMQDKGFLNINDPVYKYLPAWKSGLNGKVTIKHLLTMTSGLLHQTAEVKDKHVGWALRKNRFVQNLSPEVKPRTKWSYSNEGVQLLSPVLEAASGMQLEIFAENFLFKSLGMRSTKLMVTLGDAWTHADMLTTPRDLARIGIVMLNNGNFNGKRIVSEEFCKESLKSSEKADFYGYLWWLFKEPESLKGFAALGNLDTSMYVFPDHELIIVRMQQQSKKFTAEKGSGKYHKHALALFKKMFQPHK